MLLVCGALNCVISAAKSRRALLSGVFRQRVWRSRLSVMQKLILMSVIYATAILPLIAARNPSPRRGLRKAVVWMLAFNLIYVLAVMFVYPRFQ